MRWIRNKITRRGDQPLYPIIIGGCYRTGTSLIRRILDSHSRIHCGPEVKFFRDFYGYYNDDPLAHARFFRTVRHLDVEENDLLRIFGNALIETHVISAKKWGKVRWADKNPENVLYLNQWYSLLNGHFFFIHCVRNPLDTLASFQEVGFKQTLPDGFEDKILVWRTFTESGIKFERNYPSISFRMRYEDLVSAPRQSLSKLMDAMGESFEETMLCFNSKEHQKGLEDPKIAATKEIHQKSVGRWCQELTKEQVEAVIKKCSDLFDVLGYDLPSNM